jgi:SAM-dependent methyltransferase
MAECDRERLRQVFTEDAELYDRARPGYPPVSIDELTEIAGLRPGCRVLEIGCGTGQITAPLAERGCRIVAVELGAELAAVARRNLGRFPSVEVVTAVFEDWALPPEPFDLVVSAIAFHWIDPAVRVGKAAEALRLGGALATIATHHVAGGSAAFFVEAQDCYERVRPGDAARVAVARGLGHPRGHRRAGPLRAIRGGDHPAARVGPFVLGRAVPGRPAHVLGPSGTRPDRPSRPA